MSSSPYNPGIPTAAQTLAETHLPILTNFAELNSQFGTDHVALTAATLRGFHKKVTITEVQAAEPAALSFPNGTVYAKYQGANPNRYVNLYYQTKPENAVPATSFPINAIKAWVTFDRSTLTMWDNFNVSSVTAPGAGLLVHINFANDLQNDNYAIVVFTDRGTPLYDSSTTSEAVISGIQGTSTYTSVVIIGN